MDYKILQPNFDPVSLDSWETEVPDYCTHFYVFSPVLQLKKTTFFWMKMKPAFALQQN